MTVHHPRRRAYRSTSASRIAGKAGAARTGAKKSAGKKASGKKASGKRVSSRKTPGNKAVATRAAANPGAIEKASGFSAPKGLGARRDGGRLSRRDWIVAGQDVLREHGVSGLKLAPLTRRLGVSTGSFYHHFPDFDAYLGAVAEAFSIDRVQGLLDRARAEGVDPVGRIRALAKLSLADHTFDLDRAMRVWATMEERARIAMRRAEELVLAFLTEAFCDLGFSPSEASLRAGVLLSVNVMPLSMRDPKTRSAFFKDALRLMIEARSA